MIKRKIEFYRHNLTQKDKDECLDVLSSIFLTTGEVVKKFESNFAKYVRARYAVGVSSCTDALFLALKYIGIKKGDEVITTALSFVATSNAVEYCNAKPVFIDVEEDTGNINADLIEKAITSKTKAILVVHLYGLMCDMVKIRKIADKHDLKVIEDCAQCIEGERDGVRVGELADFACFSFYATKTITCGEGGAITCNSKEAYEWLLKARLHGMSKNAAERYTSRYQHYDMEFLGYKCNMTNIQASLLLSQLNRIDKLLTRREEIAKIYDKGFANNHYLSMPDTLPNSVHARYIYTFWVNRKKRDEYLDKIQDKGIGVAVHLRPIHLMSFYKNKYGYKRGDFPISERIGDCTISIPFYLKLTKKEIDYIINSVNSIVVE